MNLVTREKHYSALDYIKAIAEKFRDVPERLFGRFWSRNSNQNPRKSPWISTDELH